MVRFTTRTQHDHCTPVHGVVDSIEVAGLDVGMDAADVLAGMHDADGHLLDGVHVDVRLSAASTGNALIRNLKVQSPTAASTV